MARPLLLFMCFILLGCGGPSKSRVQGRLTSHGAPFALPADSGEVGIVFTRLGDDGNPIPFKMYSAIVQADGTFEVVAAAGECEPGVYQVAIDAAKAKSNVFQPFQIGKSKARVTFKPGENDIKVDIAKPTG
jgi:hypothetical protein